MYTITLTVRQVGADLHMVAETSEPGLTSGVRVEEMLFLDAANLPDEFALTAENLRQYGQAIGQAVFHGEVLSTFDRIQARADADGQPLHVLLSVEVERLRAVRWERLCAPLSKGWKFLRLQQRTPFSIYLPSKIDKRYPTISRVELKALVVVANLGPGDPYGLAEFKAGPVVESIRQALGKEIPCTVLASDAGELLAGADGLPTLDELCRRLTMERFPILHIVCHGKYDKSDEKEKRPNETFLFLHKSGPLNPEKPDDHIERVSATTFIERLQQVQGVKTLPHLTFLCSCETASPRAEQGLGGLGQRLVRELGMPAVVAMTEPVGLPLAQQLAGEFYTHLRQHGYVDLALDEACAGIADRGDVLIPTLFSRLGGRKLFDEFGQLTIGEWEKGLERLGPLVEGRAPALRLGFEELASRARAVLEIRKRTENSTPNDPAAAGARDELQKKLQPDLNEMCEDFLEQSFDSLARDLPLRLPKYDARCPFPGLGVFDVVKNEQGQVEDFRPFFFGRKELTEKVCVLLREHRFLGVLGGSGTGKSSLVRAGVLEQLRREKPDLRVVIFPPGKDPVGRLRQERAGTPAPEILVVDQFEELFTLCTDSNARTAFLAELLPLREQFPVVITMRTDFLGECAEHDDLHALLNSATKHLELLQPLRGDELREVVERQRNAVGLQFEPELAKRVFEDLEHEPGAMPLLQHCLRQLWRCRRGRKLCFVEYLNVGRVGGVKGAISRTADEVYGKLPTAEQELCPFIFERLVRIDAGAIDQEVRRDTRQREELSQLTPEGGDADLTKTVVTRLADAKLLITTQNPLTQATEVEVAHEALIRHWDKLQNWLANARVTARLAERVRTDAGRYYGSQANPDNLTLRGVVLVEAEILLNTKPPRLPRNEASFIRLCRTHENEKKDRELQNARERELLAIGRAEDAKKATDKQRRLTRWAVGAAAVAITSFVVAVFFQQRSTQNEKEARNAKYRAEKTLAVELLRPIGRDPNIFETAEDDSLYALAAIDADDDNVRELFVRLALEDSTKAEHLARRVNVVLHAAVGLVQERKERAVRLFIEKIQNDKDAGVRLASAFGVAALQPKDAIQASEAASLLGEYIAKLPPPSDIQRLTVALRSLADRVSPQKASEIGRQITLAMPKSTELSTRNDLAKALAALADQLPYEQASALIIQAMRYSTEPALAEKFKALASKLTSDQSAEVAGLITLEIQMAGPATRGVLAIALTELVGELPRDQARKQVSDAADLIIQVILETTPSPAEPITARASDPLSNLFEGIMPGMLTKILSSENLSSLYAITALGYQVAALKSLAVVLDPPQAAKAADVIIKAMGKTDNSIALRHLVEGLEVLVSKLDRQQTARASEAIILAMRKTDDPFALRRLAQGLRSLADKLDPKLANKQADSAATVIIQSMNKTSHVLLKTNQISALQAFPEGLVALADKLDYGQAAKATREIVQLMRKTTTLFNKPQDFATVLGAFIDKLSPDQRQLLTIEAVGWITQAIEQTSDLMALRNLEAGLVTLAKKLDRKQAAAEIVMIKAAMRTENALAMIHLSTGLLALADKLPAEQTRQQTAEASALVIPAMRKTPGSFELRQMAMGLRALADKLPAEQARQLAAEASDIIIRAMRDTIKSSALADLATGLQALAGLLDSDQARGATKAIIVVMRNTTGGAALRDLAGVLDLLVGRLPAEQAWQLAAEPSDLIIRTMRKTDNSFELRQMATGLRALAGRLPAEQARQLAAEASDLIIRAMRKTNSSSEMRYLAEVIKALVSKLPLEQARQLAAEAAGLITQAMRKTTNSSVSGLGDMALGVQALAEMLPPELAARMAGELTKSICSTSFSSDLESMTQGIKTLADTLPPRQAAGLAAIMIQAMHKATTPSAVRHLAERLNEVAKKTEIRALVNLLKSPFCTGEARTVVLNELGSRTGVQQNWITIWDMVEWMNKTPQFLLDNHIDLLAPMDREDW